MMKLVIVLVYEVEEWAGMVKSLMVELVLMSAFRREPQCWLSYQQVSSWESPTGPVALISLVRSAQEVVDLIHVCRLIIFNSPDSDATLP